MQVLLGYTAERAGMVISPAAIVMIFMMAIAGRTVGKMDPRLMVCIAYIITALGVYQPVPARPHQQLRPHHRAAHAAGHRAALRLHPHQHAQLRRRPRHQDQPDLLALQLRPQPGRLAGTALLTTYIARTAQVHQTALAANVVQGSPAFTSFTDRMKEMLMQQGMTPAAAGQAAVGEAYQMMLRQATMLSYKNAFTLLGFVVVLLSPLPFLMRLPPKRPARPGAKAPEPSPEELAAH